MIEPLITFGPMAPTSDHDGFAVGDLVVNCGVGARVIAINPDGSLRLRETVPLGPLPADWDGPFTWDANPAITRKAV